MHGSLARHAHLMRDADPAGAKKAAQELFDQHEILVIFPADVAEGRIDAMWVEAIGKRLYGRRPK